MSWKDRASKVEEDAPKSSWRDRAVPVNAEQTPKEEVSMTESGLRGAAQGASMGFADEIESGVRALHPDMTYEDALKAVRNKYKVAEESNPATYMAGNVGGGVATSLIPGLGGANLAKLAAMGAVSGLGNSEADLTKGEFGQAAVDTAIGGGLGVGAKYAGDAIGAGAKKVLPMASNYLDDVAESAAVRNLGFGKKTIERLGVEDEFGEKGINKLGRMLLDEGQTSPNATTQKRMVDELTQKYGSNLGKIHDELSKSGGMVDTRKIIQSIKDKAAGEFDNPALAQEASDAVLGSSSATSKYLEEPIQSLKDTKGVMKQLDDQIFSQKTGEMAGTTTTAQKNQLRQAMDSQFKTEAQQTAQSIGKPELYDDMLQSNEKYGLLKNADRLTTSKAAREMSDRPMGLRDIAAATLGPKAYVGNKIADKYGNYVLAHTADATSKVMNKMNSALSRPDNVFGQYTGVLRDAAARGEQALSATHYTLYKSNPEYRQQYDAMNSEEEGE